MKHTIVIPTRKVKDAIKYQNNLLTNKYPNAIIPDRDSIWTQNYTLAEITGILKKRYCPGTDGCRNRKRYELVFIGGQNRISDHLWKFDV